MAPGRSDTLVRVVDAPHVQRIYRLGALILDVDDTLIPRAGCDSAGENLALEPTVRIALLLLRGFHVGIVTGHGWTQLNRKLIRPIVDILRQTAPHSYAEAIARLHVYANGGATKAAWNGHGHATDLQYGHSHGLRSRDMPVLCRILQGAATELTDDWQARKEWYQRSFPLFDFHSLPAAVEDREGAVLVLRPVPSRAHAARDVEEDPRAQLHSRTLRVLADGDLGEFYDLRESGRSTIELMRRSVSKALAIQDIIHERVAGSCSAPKRVEAALLYIGDEFYYGGNDAVIPCTFPECLCVSVAGGTQLEDISRGVLRTEELTGWRGPAATHQLLSHVLDLLDE
jgi:hypothetical protein